MLGIYSPYSWCDSTNMSITLADLADALTLPVTLYAADAPCSGIHPGWDNRVHSRHSRNIKKWLYDCEHIVWFSLDPALLTASKRFGCKNTLVVLYDQISPGYIEALDVCDHIVCPSGHRSAFLREFWACPRIENVPWDATCAIRRRPAGENDSVVRVLVVLQPAATNRFGARLAYALSLLLDIYPELQITLLMSKSPDLPTKRAFADLRMRHSSRVSVTRRLGLYDRYFAHYSSDWTLYAYHCDDAVMVPREALINGSPVVSFDSASMRECIIPNQNGCLLPTTMSADLFRQNNCADPTMYELVHGLGQVLSNKRLLNEIRNTNWPQPSQIRSNFIRSWRAILGHTL